MWNPRGRLSCRNWKKSKRSFGVNSKKQKTKNKFQKSQYCVETFFYNKVNKKTLCALASWWQKLK